MNSDDFVNWMEPTAFNLRRKFGPNCCICIVIDNAIWHSELTDETKPPKRSWRESEVQAWLQKHAIGFSDDLRKSEILQLAFDNLPPKEFRVDAMAEIFNIEILRLPIKHCSLNPMEFAW